MIDIECYKDQETRDRIVAFYNVRRNIDTALYH
jgi:hypothetical protein